MNRHKKITLISVAFVAIVALLVFGTAYACHFAKFKVTTKCEQATVEARYDGLSNRYYVLKLYIDGALVKETPKVKDNVSASVTKSLPPGQHYANARVFEYQKKCFFGCWYEFKGERPAPPTKFFDVEPCYTACDETIALPTQYSPWELGTPVFGPYQNNGDGTYTRYGTREDYRAGLIVFVDKYDNNHICDQVPISETRVVELEETVEVSCEEVIDMGKVYGSVYDTGDPVFGPWQDNGDGTFTRYGSQATRHDWTQAFHDAQFPDEVCRIDEGFDEGSRRVEETVKGKSRFDSILDCEGASICFVRISPIGEDIIVACESFEWQNPKVDEEVVLMDTLFKEPKDCNVCKWKGVFEYTLGGNFPCTLVTDRDGGGEMDRIPSRFLNPVYTTPICKFCDIDWIWDGSWTVRQQNTCDIPKPCYTCP